MSGCVYFIQNTETMRIKIGYTSKGVDKRLAQLQGANCSRLELLGFVFEGREVERALHTLFADHQARGEWFSGDISSDVHDIIHGGARPWLKIVDEQRAAYGDYNFPEALRMLKTIELDLKKKAVHDPAWREELAPIALKMSEVNGRLAEIASRKKKR